MIRLDDIAIFTEHINDMIKEAKMTKYEFADHCNPNHDAALEEMHHEDDEEEEEMATRCDGCGEIGPWGHRTKHVCPVCHGTGERRIEEES